MSLFRGAYKGSVTKTGLRLRTFLVPGSGTGTVDIQHGLYTTDICSVLVQRIIVVGSAPIGVVNVFWLPTDLNTVRLDFDTYSRTLGEFKVTISG